MSYQSCQSQGPRRPGTLVTRTWTNRKTQTRSLRVMTRTKTTGEATETETETEKMCTTDTDVSQTITGPSNLPILVNTHVDVRAQGTPQQPSSLATDSSSVSSPVPSEPVVVILDSTMTPPSTPTSASAHSSDAKTKGRCI
ncbi:hypothetical protein M405DRAFT_865431 [Rhizopogon salebrosus TDB-379]|nr:hypothetical protein M405DRAFT_865431 [Rhizopogon salebrosus TDB-379]